MGLVAAEKPRMQGMASNIGATGQNISAGNFSNPPQVETSKNTAGDYRDNLTAAKNNKDHNTEKSASIWERSFAMGIVQDIVKTLAKVLFGSMPVSLLGGTLKDNTFSLDKVAYTEFITAFPSKFLADAAGAISRRLFNGKTKIFGKLLPYIPASIASQLFSNPIVKFWRSLSSNYNLNKQSAEKDHGEAADHIRKELSQARWFKVLEKFRSFFEKNIKPKLDTFLSAIFGIRPGEVVKDKDGNPIRDERGKKVKTEPKVNWVQTGLVAATSFALTASMPRNTQVYGFDDINNSQGIWKALRTVFAVVIQSLSRLETNLFKNAVGIHTDGYGYDACLKTAMREKMLAPLSQYTVDGLSAVLSKFIPINGATMSILLRLPFETIAAFLSSGLVGVSKENRMPDHWKYLGDSLWKPVAEKFEKVCLPLYRYTIKPLYNLIFGFFPNKYNDIYRQYHSEPLKDEIKEKFEKEGLWSIFFKSCMPWNLYSDIKNLVEQSKSSDASEKVDEAKATAPADSEQQALHEKPAEKVSADDETEEATNPYGDVRHSLAEAID